MWKSRSRLLFAAGAGLSGLMMVQMFMYAGHTLLNWDLNFNVFQICRQLLESLHIGYLVDGLNLLVLLTFIVASIMTIRQIIAERAALRHLDSLEHSVWTKQLNATYATAGLGRIQVIEYDRPAAFTLGLLQPRIIVSTELLSMLDEEEQAAVIYHEAHHMRHYDPLKTWTLQLSAVLLFYIPVLRHILEHYKTAREILADNEAIHRTGSPAGLGSALLKLLKKPSTEVTPVTGAVHSFFAGPSINYRILRILHPDKDLPPRMPRKPVMISVQVLSVLTLLFAFAVI
ncbi:heat shock protein HtpX [compost metagenome]